MQKDFGRVLTAMVTPFTTDNKLNIPAAQTMAKYLVSNGSDGLVIAGTTGESPTLTKEEKFELFKEVKGVVGKDVPVLAGTGSYNTEESVNQTKLAEKAGVDGILAVVPYYNKPSQEGLYQHYSKIAKSTYLPIMLYNIPSRTGCNLLPNTVARLAEIDNIVAIKESSGNMDQMTELKRQLGNDFLIYSGDDSLTLPMLSLGGHGIVSVVSHLIGEKIKLMVQKFHSGEKEEALALHLEMFELIKTMFITTNPVPIKTALALLGFEVGGFRLPLVKATEEEVTVIKKVMQKNNLL
ncbi:4-hydroxy-tetrahydrodipicolinate synthase [Bacillota bacterium LX-D]|nr:4-hydroxy-tetrahydrodipicolinate synthase [Bacillota bacterium LX-D]